MEVPRSECFMGIWMMEFASWGLQICPTSKTHKMLLLAIELLSRPSAGEENPGICRIARWLVGRAMTGKI